MNKSHLYIAFFIFAFPSTYANINTNSLIIPGCLVFDVGAHIGNKTAEYLRQGAHVICFEPQPQCAKSLRIRYKNNPNVIVEEVGLAEKQGSLKLMICNDASCISTFSQDWKHGRFSNYKWDTEINVPVITLDIAIKKYGLPHFCKIDVEGFEYDVLQGLTRPIKYISFEFAKEFLSKTTLCLNYLTSLGYNKFNLGIGEHSALLFKDWVTAKEILHTIETNRNPLLWGDVYAQAS